MGKKTEKVKKLRIERDPARTYRVRNGNVYVSTTPREVHGGGNVIVMPDEFELLVETGAKQEAGWIYFLDGDGDLARTKT